MFQFKQHVCINLHVNCCASLCSIHQSVPAVRGRCAAVHRLLLLMLNCWIRKALFFFSLKLPHMNHSWWERQ